ncbi:hypothetical protein GDO78_017332 [Eleutherodactylus coqui]|uniref:Uncharacterized protein n=1 Tax=Eleutherodactylus coqui TaxID=57060 RepID=A0A8J6E7J0_ELECQ|nr:hypothetical protein GDO78_017332 [Eleutherodactylus coqui]
MDSTYTNLSIHAVDRECYDAEITDVMQCWDLPQACKKNAVQLLSKLLDHWNIITWNAKDKLMHKNIVILGTNLPALISDSTQSHTLLRKTFLCTLWWWLMCQIILLQMLVLVIF